MSIAWSSMKGQPRLSIFPHSFTMCSAGEVSRRWYQLSEGWLCDELPTRCSTAENVSPCIFWIKQPFIMMPHCDTSAAQLQFFLLPTNVRGCPKIAKVCNHFCSFKIGEGHHGSWSLSLTNDQHHQKAMMSLIHNPLNVKDRFVCLAGCCDRSSSCTM